MSETYISGGAVHSYRTRGRGSFGVLTTDFIGCAPCTAHLILATSAQVLGTPIGEKDANEST